MSGYAKDRFGYKLVISKPKERPYSGKTDILKANFGILT